MLDLAPQPGDLDPIETAPVEELRALQLERLQWSVRHAYDQVAHYRRAFDEAGVGPDDVRSLADLARDHGTTMLVVTHEMQFAREVGDRVVFMDGGKIVEQGRPPDVLDNPREERTRRFLRRSLQLAHSLEDLSVTNEEGAAG